MGKNTMTIEQLKLLCRHVKELRDSGFTENIAIRLLELGANIYAKERAVGNASPDRADQYDLWSKKARKAQRRNAEQSYGQYLRVEHGTPRRQFARLVLDAYERGKLTKAWMERHCTTKWRVAVITHEEDKRLSRSELFKSPEERWRAAGIEFEADKAKK